MRSFKSVKKIVPVNVTVAVGKIKIQRGKISDYQNFDFMSRTSRGLAGPVPEKEEPSTAVAVDLEESKKNKVNDSTSSPDMWTRNIKLLFCFLGLQV